MAQERRIFGLLQVHNLTKETQVMLVLHLIRKGGYFHLLLIDEINVYGQHLENPGAALEDRFLTFVIQILDKIDTRLNLYLYLSIQF